jgi:integrase
MDTERLPQNCDLYKEGAFWMLRWHEGAANEFGLDEAHWREQAQIGPANGPNALTEEDVPRFAWNHVLSLIQQSAQAQRSEMTIADFVEKKFVPNYVAIRKTSCRLFYRAILKHIVTPEDVDRMFQVDADRSRAKLKTLSDWPYVGWLRLRDARPEHVQRLISAALERGYSTQTANHIRNVVSAIFSCARNEYCFDGENPANQVVKCAVIRKETQTLTLAQANEMLDVMQYPEKEMALIAILTNLTVSEICGLQWKHVNLTGNRLNVDGKVIPPLTLAARKQWYRFLLIDVGRSRERDVPIPEILLPMFIRLSCRQNFTEPEDFVLASKNGTPICEANIALRRLKPLGRAFGIPSLTWNTFRHAHLALVTEYGEHYQYHVAKWVRTES